MDRPSFNKSILTKVFIAFLIALAALAASYLVNKLAFSEIKSSVNALSFPNKKLIVVNNLFFEINETEKSFRNLISDEKEVSVKSFLQHSGNMKNLTDSLSLLCMENRYQSDLIDSVQRLLSVRERMLLDYAEFRQVLNTNSNLLKQTRILDSIISGNQGSRDSLLLTRQRRRVIMQIDSVEIKSNDKRGLWKKIFGGKPEDSVKIKRIVKSEVNTDIDTLLRVNKDSLLPQIQTVIMEMAEGQQQRRRLFLRREARLAGFENTFNGKIIQLLSEVQKDILNQTRETHVKAEVIVNQGIHRIYLIFLFFIIAAVVIALFLLADISRSNKYKQLLLKAKEEAEANSLARQRFLSNMSHEIRTPLQSVIGYAEQIRGQIKPDADALDAIHLASRHLLSVINEILDYNSITSGQFVFEKEDFDLNAAVKNVIAILSHQITRKGLSVHYDENKVKGIFVKGDAFRLKQVLLNIISNAIKFTNEGSISVEIEQETRDGHVFYVFYISDTGVGIPESQLSVIFNRFEQSDLPQKYAGSGLGLSIVKLLVEAQGGHVSVQSKVGMGSCFRFEIPYMAGSSKGLSGLKEVPVSVSTEHYVWLLDDDTMILHLCAGILKKQGIPFRIFKSAKEMLDAAPDPAPDMVMLDIRMPDIDGIQLLEKIKPALPGASFIAITAQSLPDEQADIMRNGFDRILLKPFTEADLLALFSKYNNRNISPGSIEVPDKLSIQPDNILDDEIRRQFIGETESDLKDVAVALASADSGKLVLLLHRIAGRCAQVGLRDIAKGFRRQEILIHNVGKINRTEILQLTEELRSLLSKL